MYVYILGFSTNPQNYRLIFGALTKEDVGIFRRITLVIAVAYNTKNSSHFTLTVQEFRSALERVAKGYKRTWVMFGFTGVFAQKRLHGKSGVVHTLITP